MSKTIPELERATVGTKLASFLAAEVTLIFSSIQFRMDSNAILG